jgi:hypothetical protein
MVRVFGNGPGPARHHHIRRLTTTGVITIIPKTIRGKIGGTLMVNIGKNFIGKNNVCGTLSLLISDIRTWNRIGKIKNILIMRRRWKIIVKRIVVNRHLEFSLLGIRRIWQVVVYAPRFYTKIVFWGNSNQKIIAIMAILVI